MASQDSSEARTNEVENPLVSFFDNILQPGSSLDPRFLAILDGAFAGLLAILSILAFLTSGNAHIFILIGIELSLWASVKWFVNEVKKFPPPPPQAEAERKVREKDE